jgi:hypothetical protein
MSGDTTTYALTGQVAATLRQYPITAAQGSYAVTGQAATLTPFASSVTALVWGAFPSSGTVSVASTPFSIGANGTVGTSIVVTMSDAANGGTFTPTTVTLTTGSPSQTFTYTPGSTGGKTISVTSSPVLTYPASITYTSNASGGTGTVTLNWTASADPSETGYRVYYGTSSGTYVQTYGQGIDVGNVTTYNVTGLSTGVLYYFAVTAYDAGGNESAYSTETSRTAP